RYTASDANSSDSDKQPASLLRDGDRCANARCWHGRVSERQGADGIDRSAIRGGNAADDLVARRVVRLLPRARELREREQRAQSIGAEDARDGPDDQRAVLSRLQAG